MHEKIATKIEDDNKEEGFGELKPFDTVRGVFSEGGEAIASFTTRELKFKFRDKEVLKQPLII